MANARFAAIFAKLGYFTMITLAALVCWQGSLTRVVVAARAVVRPWYYIHTPEPLRDDHPLSVQECIVEDVNVCMYVRRPVQHDPKALDLGSALKKLLQDGVVKLEENSQPTHIVLVLLCVIRC